MRFVSLVRSTVERGRRYLSAQPSVLLRSEGDEKNVSPAEVAKAIRALSARVAELEARVPGEAVEFEVSCSSGGTKVYLHHNFNGPVRWYVTDWLTDGLGATPPASGHSLAHDTTSTTNILVLRSYVAGRAVIRVEPSQSASSEN